MAESTAILRPRRARPWDAGPEATARDLAALRFVGEQYTARSDVLSVLLGRLSPAVVREPGRLGDRTVRQRVERWEAAGWPSAAACSATPGSCPPGPGCD